MARIKQIIPEEAFADHVLIPGGAFKIPHAGAGKREKTRYFFVLNANPKKDKILLLVTPTTRIAKAQKRSKTHLLYLGPKQYSQLTQRCVIECNQALHKFSRAKVIRGLRKNKGKLLPPLPKKLFAKLRQAILSAPIHSEEEKNMIAPQEPKPSGKRAVRERRAPYAVRKKK